MHPDKTPQFSVSDELRAFFFLIFYPLLVRFYSLSELFYRALSRDRLSPRVMTTHGAKSYGYAGGFAVWGTFG